MKVKAIGKERPRMGKNGVVYTPKNTSNYEKIIKQNFKEQNEVVPNEWFEKNVIASICIGYQIPKSYSKKKKKKLINKGYPHRPDVDNIAKAILDSLNGIAYKDDAQVTCLTIYKQYSEEDCVNVVLTYVDFEEVEVNK